MHAAGAVGFSDDGVTVMNAALMRDALTLSAEIGFPSWFTVRSTISTQKQ